MSGIEDVSKTAMQVMKKADEADYPKGLVVAGAALIALPYAAQGLAKLTGGSREKAGEKAGSIGDKISGKVEGKVKDVVGDVAEEKLGGGLPGPVKGIKDMLGGDSGDSGDESDSDGSDDGEGGSAAPGHGSGRRMPIQQSVDVAVPIEIAYNLWTQFEDWPSFMHRVDQVDQVDETTVSMSAKVWGITKRFEAEIVEQRPDERIEWDVSQGLAHTGVATFHELAPRLTRIELTIDIEPDSLLEKAGRGMRFTKRAVRGDLHRFKAFAELQEEAEEGWRGTIEDGEVKQKTESKSQGRSRSQSRNGSGSSGRSKSKGSSKS